MLALAFVRPPAAVSALATAALANVVLGVLGVAEPWLTIPLLPLAALASLAVRPSARLLAGTLGVYLLAMAIEPAWVALSPFGPTQNSRFYGVSNLLESRRALPRLRAGDRDLRLPTATYARQLDAGGPDGRCPGSLPDGQ